MSTHRGTAKGIFRNLALFGIQGTLIIISRIINMKILEFYMNILEFFGIHNNNVPSTSIRKVSHNYNIPFYKINKINSQQFNKLIDIYNPDLLVSLSCPQIIGKKVRDRFPLGCINVHGAPLPRYRGLMPAFWVLRNGESVTAVTVHDLAPKLDDGDILVQHEVSITPEDTWDSLVKKTKSEGALALIDAIQAIKNNSVKRKPNLESDATYYSFPTSQDRKVFLSLGRNFFNSSFKR